MILFSLFFKHNLHSVGIASDRGLAYAQLRQCIPGPFFTSYSVKGLGTRLKPGQ